MINEEYKAMLGGKSVIRELSEYATSRGAEIGYQNVFDYSLGNPSVPAPKSFTDAMVDLYENGDPVAIHGYSPSLGIPSVKDAIAENLNERFVMAYTGNHIFPTTGAAGALSHAMRAVTKPGDEIITFAPYFPEYQPYVKGAGAKLTIVPADTENFQINFDAFEKALNPGTAAVLINTPNNPSGAVYSAETLTRLAEVLNAKQTEYGHDIFLIAVVVIARGVCVPVNGRAVTVGGKIGGQSSQKRVEGAIIIAVFQVRKGAFADLLNAIVRQSVDGVSLGGNVPVPLFHGQEEQHAVICIAVVIVIIVGIVLRTFSVQSVHRQDDHVHFVFLPKRLRLFFQRRFLRGRHEIGVVNDILLLRAGAQGQRGEKQQAQNQANQFVFHTVSLLKASEAAPATQAARHRR